MIFLYNHKTWILKQPFIVQAECFSHKQRNLNLVRCIFKQWSTLLTWREEAPELILSSSRLANHHWDPTHWAQQKHQSQSSLPAMEWRCFQLQIHRRNSCQNLRCWLPSQLRRHPHLEYPLRTLFSSREWMEVGVFLEKISNITWYALVLFALLYVFWWSLLCYLVAMLQVLHCPVCNLLSTILIPCLPPPPTTQPDDQGYELPPVPAPKAPPSYNLTKGTNLTPPWETHCANYCLCIKNVLCELLPDTLCGDTMEMYMSVKQLWRCKPYLVFTIIRKVKYLLNGKRLGSVIGQRELASQPPPLRFHIHHTVSGRAANIEQRALQHMNMPFGPHCLYQTWWFCLHVIHVPPLPAYLHAYLNMSLLYLFPSPPTGSTFQALTLFVKTCPTHFF